MPKDWQDTNEEAKADPGEVSTPSWTRPEMFAPGEQSMRGIQEPSDSGESDWVDRGIVDVPVADLPWPDGVEGSEDFDHHIAYDDAIKVTKRLEDMRPLIKQGHSSQEFAEMDKAAGRDYEHGDQRIYDLYYGSDPIRVDKDGDSYDIVSGRHRIVAAKTVGLDSIPARVVERIRR